MATKKRPKDKPSGAFVTKLAGGAFGAFDDRPYDRHTQTLINKDQL